LKADPQPRSEPAEAFRTELIAQVGKAQRVFVVAVLYLHVCKLGLLAKEAGRLLPATCGSFADSRGKRVRAKGRV
jgi:hypothetical protein